MTQKIIDTKKTQDWVDSTASMQVQGLVVPPTDTAKLLWNKTQQDDYSVLRAQVKKSLPDDWVATTTYGSGNLVTYKLKFYKSLQNSNIGKTPDTEPTWWVEVSASAVPPPGIVNVPLSMTFAATTGVHLAPEHVSCVQIGNLVVCNFDGQMRDGNGASCPLTTGYLGVISGATTNNAVASWHSIHSKRTGQSVAVASTNYGHESFGFWVEGLNGTNDGYIFCTSHFYLRYT